MAFRKVLFWIHLAIGVVAGLVVLLMSVTGVLLMYEKQMIAWSDSGFRSASETAAPSIEKILAEAGAGVQAVTVFAEPGAPAALALGRNGTAYVDSATGKRLGMAAPEMRGFLGTMKEWHRWLGLQSESRATGRAITGACNLGFLFLVVSGAYLWLPKVFSWKHFRAVLWFRSGLSGKAREFNWHNAIGVWCVVPLFFVVLSGVVISYGWASDLVFRVVGSQPPKPPAGGGPPREQQPSQQPLVWEGIDAGLRMAMKQEPQWNSINLRVPTSNDAPLVFSIDAGTGGQPQKRGTLTYDRGEARPLKWEGFDSLEKGRQWRTWLRFVHTGEYYGIVGQTIAGIASLGAAFLVYTGVALSLRRFAAWRKRRSSAHAAGVSVA